MRSRLLSLVSAAATALLACPAAAGPVAELDLGPHERLCDLHHARPVETQAVIDHPDRYLGQCVSMIAYRVGPTLHAERTGAERGFSSGRRELWDGTGRIGLYSPDDDRGPFNLIMLTRVVGVVSDCRCLQDGESMVLGYCHYFVKGPIISAVSLSAAE